MEFNHSPFLFVQIRAIRDSVFLPFPLVVPLVSSWFNSFLYFSSDLGVFGSSFGIRHAEKKSLR